MDNILLKQFIKAVCYEIYFFPVFGRKFTLTGDNNQ